MAQRRTKAQIAAENQALCAHFYANARSCKPVKCFVHEQLSPEQSAIYWQNGAQAHFAKTSHYTGLAEHFWPSK